MTLQLLKPANLMKQPRFCKIETMLFSLSLKLPVGYHKNHLETSRSCRDPVLGVTKAAPAITVIAPGLGGLTLVYILIVCLC